MSEISFSLPTWLKNKVKDCREVGGLNTMTLCSSSGSEELELWYYGDLFTVKGETQQYIVNADDAPALIVARDPETDEEFLVFDYAKHGYDSMFCDTYNEEKLCSRPLKRFDIPASRLTLQLGYSIDYDDEKEEYDFDENGLTVLIDGRHIPWDEVKTDGFDYLAMFYTDNTGKEIQFVDAELA
ncbi:hypothetical protein ACYULU_04620 [Breznakiellaceae bacterium SP9]